MDREKSGDIYEVEVKSNGVEYDLDIDAKTGKVLRTDKDDHDNDDFDEDDSDDKVIVHDGKFITEKAAIEIAMKQAKGTVTEVELDEDDGRVVYEIEIKEGKYDYDFDIDAISGEVLNLKKIAMITIEVKGLFLNSPFSMGKNNLSVNTSYTFPTSASSVGPSCKVTAASRISSIFPCNGKWVNTSCFDSR